MPLPSPHRASGSQPFPSHRASASVPAPPPRTVGSGVTLSSYETLRLRVLLKLNDRLDPARSRRMPESLLRQTARQHAEHLVEVEAARLAKPDRERLVEEVLSEAFGFGPLEELFADPLVREVMVLGPQAVVIRRDHGWTPSNVKFRDIEQLQDVMEKVVAQGEAAGGGLTDSAIDVRLPNGFRAVAVVPPAALGQPMTVVFVRSMEATVLPPAGLVGHGSPIASPYQSPVAGARMSGSVSVAPRVPGGSFRVPTPPPRQAPPVEENLLARHRARVIERILSKLASMGVFDLTKLDPAELRGVVTAYVHEYCVTERVHLADTDQARLAGEIITTMTR